MAESVSSPAPLFELARKSARMNQYDANWDSAKIGEYMTLRRHHFGHVVDLFASLVFRGVPISPSITCL